MKSVMIAIVLAPLAVAAHGGEIPVDPGSLLATLAQLTRPDGNLPDSTTLRLSPGEHLLDPSPYTDPSCGNCEDPGTAAEATLGWRISGKAIRVLGPGKDDGSARIVTRSGYGLLFEDCQDCELAGLTITGGCRDADAKATSAAVLARRSRLSIVDCDISENLGDTALVDSIVVGVIGIAGREGAELTIRGNRITRNSWDGIALYRGAAARIEDNLIDGVDGAGRGLGGGRGVGIGATWDARAEIRRNRVARYWKGIGLFVNAQGVVEDNVIERMLAWGIAVWDADKGAPGATIFGNLIYDCGACGISLAFARSESPGACRSNLIVRSGQNPKYDDPEYYCYQCPIALHAVPEGYPVEYNLLWDNRRAPGAPGLDDATRPDFLRDAGAPVERLSRHPAMEGSIALDELRRLLAAP